MTLFWERRYPHVLGVVSGVSAFFLPNRLIPSDVFMLILMGSASVSASICLWLFYHKFLMPSLERKRIVGQLKEVGIYRHILDYLVVAILQSIALLIFSAIDFMARYQSPEVDVSRIEIGVWTLLAVTALATLRRFLGLFSQIVESKD